MKLNLENKKFLTSRTKKEKYILPENNEKEDYVRTNFNEIAAKYDLFNDAATFGQHRLWKNKTVQALSLPRERPSHVIDLCCGSGDLTLRLTQMLPSGSEITAIDFSPDMLLVLKRRLKNEHQKGVTVHVKEGNISRMEFLKENSLDGAVIGFGLRNVLNRDECLREIYRILKPGAALAILDVGRVNSPFISLFHRLYFEKIVPILGNIIHGKKHEMYEYLPASARVYPGQEELKMELENLGYKRVQYRNFMFGATSLHTAWK